MPKLPSAEEFCQWSARDHIDAGCVLCLKRKEYGRAVLEAAAEQIVRAYEPSSYRDASIKIAEEIRAMKEDL